MDHLEVAVSVKSLRPHFTPRRLHSRLLIGAASLLLAVATVGLSASAYAATSRITVSGVADCHGGAVEGVWVASSGGGSGWAGVHSFKTGKNDGSASDARYARTFSTALPSNISLHVGCGGSLSSWKTANYSPAFKASGSVNLNVFCGDDQSRGPCSFPATGKTTTRDLGDPGYCTEGALRDFHAYDGLWPSWSGNADAWAGAADLSNWTVTTIPMPDSIVVMPAGAHTSAVGHVAWVVSLDTNSAGAVTGLYVHEENYDGTAIVGTGHTRYWDYSLNSMYRYIAAPAAGSVSQAAQAYADGAFVRATDDGEVYRIAGGAPIYVSAWSAVGGSQRTVNVSRAQLNALPKVPRDGTFIRGGQTGQVYRIAGGAPIYVSSWSSVGGPHSYINVDQAAIDRAGRGGVWNHLSFHPADGTFIRGEKTGRVYRIAGGAPIYVSSWSSVGGPHSYVNVDQAAIDRAGRGGAWNHLA